ncbi:BREX-4 system phosphatase PglZ [Lacrimispora celerecrescens]|uniref:BREX-4 system phosphatase PglZ n=1 Tax=Lacrimispora celerecrescens TaxID=29354 RepID=A0A084JBU1_9FIRM|nr:BREX-4 system phosphatase PglZ [Lacrimispora celerecrescens]KEZ86425.1 hypothetical protein IO98_23020 [Lacrimispora celerecrescens]
MYCNNVEECFRQISTYFNGKSTGYALVFDTENIGVYSEVIQRLEADKSKNCMFVSNSCQKNELPDIDMCISEISKSGDFVLIGSSQALMLKSERDLENHVDLLFEQSISGHALVILNYCRRYIKKFESRDPRISNRVLLVGGGESPIPQIEIINESMNTVENAFVGINGLLAYLERMTESQLKEHRILPVKTRFRKRFFSQAVFQVTEVDGVYESLSKKYSDIAGATEKNYGTEVQWRWLNEKMLYHKSLSSVVKDELGTTSNFEVIIQDIDLQNEPYKSWLFWLAIKAFGTNNPYLNMVISGSKSVEDFEERIYLDLANADVNDPEFEKMYAERKRLLDKIPENLPMLAKYCERVGKYEKNAVYYLTDRSENEQYEFVRYLSIYDYTDDELFRAVKHFSLMLSLYLQPFVFDGVNTKVSEADVGLRDVLTEYFQEYKVQKVTNKIHLDFENKVNNYAKERPYNKLRPRSNIVSQLNKTDSELFFFDALGVEYLAFIKAKCEQYGLVVEISVAHCELPSITEKNKEFIQYFGGNYKKINELDELKHHSQVFDYEKRKEPVHLFRELEIIEEELRRIQSLLVQGCMSKAVIVSDHGASRLAVISGEENDSMLKLDEKGQHSGRCCPVESDPQIASAAFEDGFAVLANYERFKGGRKANVEVHGGATLEEVLVPVIVLSKRPENVEYCFTDPIIILKQKEVATLTLYCNIPMNKPRILVGQRFYDGEFVADQKHAKFIMPELKRSRNYVAELYDGDTSLSVSLEFKVQKSMGQEVDLFA